MCAACAPHGASNTLATTVNNNAGVYTKPRLPVGRPGAVQPLNMKLSVPPNAIGKPIADAVPIAFLIDTLHHTKNGTVSAPPPTATSEDAVPIKEIGREH